MRLQSSASKKKLRMSAKFLMLAFCFLCVLLAIGVNASVFMQSSGHPSLLDHPPYLERAALRPTGISRDAFLAFLSDEHLKQTKVLPRFTASGCLATKLPSELKTALVTEFHRRHDVAPKQSEADPALVSFSSEELRPEMTWITDSQAEKAVRSWLRQALADWCRIPNLKHETTYGVRTYKRGSILQPHADRFLTHAISAIVHIDSKELKRDWALELLPHGASHAHEVFFGDDVDCLFYESAVVPHSRLKPLDGQEYSNIFFHFSPTTWRDVAAQKMAAQ